MLHLRYRLRAIRTRDLARASCLLLAILLALFGAGSTNSLKISRLFPAGSVFGAVPPGGFQGPTQSSPIAIAHNGQFVVNVNPDANTITVLRPTPHKLIKIKEIKVGREPSSVAAHSDNNRVYVANALD